MINKQNQFDTQPSIWGAQQQHSQTASRAPVKSLEDKELSLSLPQGWHTQRQNRLKDEVYLSARVEQRTHLLVCLLGYGLLVLALLDYIHIVIPPRFSDPDWKLQTIGALVEHAMLPLLGLLFVFYRHQAYIVKREKNFLRFLSWVSLLVGLLYLLMLPFGLADTWHIYYRNNAQIAAPVSQHQQFQQIKEQLNQPTTDEQLQKLAASLTPQGATPQISQAEQNMQAQADMTRSNQKKVLIKNSLKWNLGALISGTLFILIWHLTRWARSRK